jgi:hypothetical protein
MSTARLTARANSHDTLQPLALVLFFFSRLTRRKLGKHNGVAVVEGAYFVKVLESRLRRTWLSRLRRIWLGRLCRTWLNGEQRAFRRGIGGANRSSGRLLRLGRNRYSGRLLRLARSCSLRDVSHARQEIVVNRERVWRNRSLEHTRTAARAEPIIQGETKDIIAIAGGLSGSTRSQDAGDPHVRVFETVRFNVKILKSRGPVARQRHIDSRSYGPSQRGRR